MKILSLQDNDTYSSGGELEPGGDYITVCSMELGDGHIVNMNLRTIHIPKLALYT